jgi:hypothetical protein
MNWSQLLLAEERCLEPKLGNPGSGQMLCGIFIAPRKWVGSSHSHSEVLPDPNIPNCTTFPTLHISLLCLICIHATCYYLHATYFTSFYYACPSLSPRHKCHKAGIWFLSFSFNILTLVNQNSPWHLVCAQTTYELNE